jgi:hypothetical protein
MTAVQDRIEQRIFYHKDKVFTEELINDNNIQLFINYLVYLEGLAPLVQNDILRLENIDNLFGYRYFLVINNPDVQTKCIKAYPEFYLGCIRIYQKWRDHQLEAGKTILQSDTELDKNWDEFEKYANDLNPDTTVTKKHRKGGKRNK